MESVASRLRPEFEFAACGRRLELGRRTLVMGVLNVTPDSFSDGGRYDTPERALAQARRMLEEGADVIDVGGESSRPGAEPVPADEETRRVIPVIETLLQRHPEAVVSIDTCKAAVARQALGAGACIVNDISALGADPEMAETVAAAGAGVVLMHMRGRPVTMQQAPPSPDIIADIRSDLSRALGTARSAGIRDGAILLDPGIGFGKTLLDNLRILADLSFLREFRLPLLVGTSRKSFIGALVDDGPDERLAGTLASCAAAILEGAHMIRVHDVARAREAASVADAILAVKS